MTGWHPPRWMDGLQEAGCSHSQQSKLRRCSRRSKGSGARFGGLHLLVKLVLKWPGRNGSKRPKWVEMALQERKFKLHLADFNTRRAPPLRVCSSPASSFTTPQHARAKQTGSAHALAAQMASTCTSPSCGCSPACLRQTLRGAHAPDRPLLRSQPASQPTAEG